MLLVPLLIVTIFQFVITSYVPNYDYDSQEDKEVIPQCPRDSCTAPNCACFGTVPPKNMDVADVPQFVMLTFDDAISVANAQTYFDILGSRRNKANNCPITMTFFVCHEYNDYNITNLLYRKGNEIAVHSITHETNTDNWKNSTYDRWRDEMDGMREILSTFGGIPPPEIQGHRAPFLQTAGDITFKMLSENDFLYDSSLPTRNFMDPPIWPYTLDYGFPQDCQIQPCPKSSFEGLWIVPMVQYKRISYNFGKKVTFHCSMADACTPVPTTAEETKEFLMENFNRHYKSNRAPFPLFLHEAWLRDPWRLQGYNDFIDEILNLDNVYLVTVQEVVNYMRNPISLEEYKNKPCRRPNRLKAGNCDNPKSCHFPVRNRFMTSCVECPRRYPWLGNPRGLVKKS